MAHLCTQVILKVACWSSPLSNRGISSPLKTKDLFIAYYLHLKWTLVHIENQPVEARQLYLTFSKAHIKVIGFDVLELLCEWAMKCVKKPPAVTWWLSVYTTQWMTFVDDVSPSSRPFFYLQLTLLIMTEKITKRWYSLFLTSLTHSMWGEHVIVNVWEQRQCDADYLHNTKRNYIV